MRRLCDTLFARYRAELSVSVDNETPSTLKEFAQRFSQEELNGAQSAVEAKIKESGDGIHVYDCIMEIMRKHKGSKKRNKLEVIFTDGVDTGSLDPATGEKLRDLWREGDTICISERLAKTLAEAERMGIDIIGVGFNTPNVAAFKSHIQLDRTHSEAMVPVLLAIARIKAQTGKIPPGDLSRVFDISRGGALRPDAADRMAAGPSREETVVVKSAPSVAAGKMMPSAEGGAKTTRSSITRANDIAEEVRTRSRALGTVMPDVWKDTQDIIVLPETSLHQGPEQAIRQRIRRALDAKYEQTTATYGYAYNDDWRHGLAKTLISAASDLARRLEAGDRTARLLAYIPAPENENDKKFIRELLEDLAVAPVASRITLIRKEGLSKKHPIDVVTHVVLGKALLNYERYLKKDYSSAMDLAEKARLIHLLAVLSDNPEPPDIAYLDNLLNGAATLTMRRIDFTTVDAWKRNQEYLLTAA